MKKKKHSTAKSRDLGEYKESNTSLCSNIFLFWIEFEVKNEIRYLSKLRVPL